VSTNAAQRAGIQRQIKLPNSEAFKIAARSIKIRFWRSLITMAGVILAISFLTYVMVIGAIQNHVVAADAVEAAGMTEQQQATRFWLIAISLLVCVVGISNAMLMSVTERFREIGTMKCLGALDWFVVKLFLIEACFQGLVGSAIGAGVGLFAAILVGLSDHGALLFASMPWGRAFLSVLIAMIVGGLLAIVGAVYPARRAGKMPPADAMRTEV